MRSVTRVFVIIGLALWSASCERADTERDAPSPVEPEEVTIERELTPRERIARHQARFVVVNGLTAASSQALRQVERTLKPVDATIPPALLRDDSVHFTVFFGGNNHGEREDCGCRKNPLGGLARRHALLESLRADQPDMKWWEEATAPSGPVFHVDAGNALYAHASISRGTTRAQEIARHDAASVVDALNTFPPDALLAGELDVAFGLDDLRRLARRAKFPIISANLRAEGGEAVFPGHVVVERGGVTIGVVGVTNPEPRSKTHFSERGVVVDDPVAAAKRELSALPDEVQYVVLLSNLGMSDTFGLLEQVAPTRDDIVLAVVSGTNRLTSQPEFAAGVPIVEPLNRGKYVGHASFVLNGSTVEYQNAVTSSSKALREYRLAQRSYLTTKKQLIRQEQKLAELELSIEEVKARATSQPATDAGEAQERSAETIVKQRKEAMKQHETRAKSLESRLLAVSKNLVEAAKLMTPGPAPTGGDDWVSARVVPLKLEIDEVASTRKVLDRAEKRRPKPE